MYVCVICKMIYIHMRYTRLPSPMDHGNKTMQHLEFFAPTKVRCITINGTPPWRLPPQCSSKSYGFKAWRLGPRCAQVCWKCHVICTCCRFTHPVISKYEILWVVISYQYLRSFVNHVPAAYNPCQRHVIWNSCPENTVHASTPWKHGLYKTQALEEVLKKNTSKIRHVLSWNSTTGFQHESSGILWSEFPEFFPSPTQTFLVKGLTEAFFWVIAKSSCSRKCTNKWWVVYNHKIYSYTQANL